MIVVSSLCPLIGAHRGASGEAPENTFAAFDLALEQGAELLELDVHRTTDGYLVVQHDFSLSRTASATGQIGELTLEALRRYDVGAWKGPRWAGQCIPTLDEVLDRYGDRAFLNVEIKVDRRPYPTIEAQVARAIRQRGLFDRVVVSSFDLSTVERLRRVDPAVRTGLLTEQQPDETLLRAREIGAVAVHLEADMITAPRLDHAHRRGLGVLAWTVDDPVEMVRLTELGVDAIVSNVPATLRDVVLARR